MVASKAAVAVVGVLLTSAVALSVLVLRVSFGGLGGAAYPRSASAGEAQQVAMLRSARSDDSSEWNGYHGSIGLGSNAVPAPSRSTSSGCSFDGCPSSGPFVYFLTSHRNRGASYNRLVRSVAEDVETDVSGLVQGPCVCLAVADYTNDRGMYGAPVSAALEDWPFSSAVHNATGKFSRAGGFQALLDNVVTPSATPPDRSLIFMIDADMVVFPGFTHELLTRTEQGKTAYAPVCWSTTHNETDPYDGMWRTSGTGMMALYVSDLEEVLRATDGRLPMADRTKYGREDAAFTSAIIRSRHVRIVRSCAPLWHLYHSKHGWGWTIDGMTRAKPKGPNTWNTTQEWRLPPPPKDGMQVLKSRHELDALRCRLVNRGILYPSDTWCNNPGFEHTPASQSGDSANSGNLMDVFMEECGLEAYRQLDTKLRKAFQSELKLRELHGVPAAWASKVSGTLR